VATSIGARWSLRGTFWGATRGETGPAERARKHGTKSGKPIGQPPLAQAKIDAIRAELVRGTGILKTARLCGTGVSAVHGLNGRSARRRSRRRVADRRQRSRAGDRRPDGAPAGDIVHSRFAFESPVPLCA